ncbi:hypothetical protein [Micromonospora sp. WMMD1155]|uniref:hypothetical protein n=1 Tax=Micromonospora sp. WMMD1155 TaxID=3016094 RepID=UPI00249A1E1F|nr:hypothetical protein [Micromonospora sp. WMMD1155]WFE53417.1 hypothetical protein O7617_25220 [Micromonospora sp. WMMD1155]
MAVSVLATATVLLVGSGADRRRRTALRWLVAALGWISGVSLLLYSFMFPLTLLMVLGGVFGMEVLPAYTVWGVGLLIAAGSYFGLTKPTCALTYGKAPRSVVRCGHDERTRRRP